jgi:error-prone DNA polymerase
MGIDTLALTDHDGLYGVVRFAEAAKQVGVRTAFGQAGPRPAQPAQRRPGPGQHPPAGP